MEKDTHIDSSLVNAYKLGDQSAMAKLVKRWHLKFCEKAFWLVKDKDLAKDIAQESWKTIMNNIHNLEHSNRFKSWALRIVYTKSIDALRHKQKTHLSSKHIEQEFLSDDEDQSDRILLKSRLLNAIQQLPEHQQIVLRLFYTEAYSIKEISKLMQISVGTVKSRLFHARETLKKTLNTKDYEN